jgi:hypothetical protein
VKAPTWRTWLTALVVASSGVTFAAVSIWALNVGAILSSLRLVQLVAVEVVACAAVLAVVAKRRGNLTAWAMTLSVGGLLFGAGDALARRVGTPGAWALFVVAVSSCAVLLHRVAASNLRSVRILAFWLSVFLLLQPPLSIVLDRDDNLSRILASADLPVVNMGSAEDFYVVVLDGYASLATLRDDFSFDSPLRNVLMSEGFEVAEAAWSPSTWTHVAVATLLNLEMPLLGGEGVTDADSAVLLGMIRGNARLFSMFHEAGYALTYVESGWVGSVCSDVPDVCIRRPFVDDAIQTVIDRSLIGDLAEGRWGHAFARAGIRSLGEVERMLGELGTNGANDMVFAHVMLPHGPYVLGSDCELTGTLVPDPANDQAAQANGHIARAAYLTQVRCVDSWLTEIAAQVPENAAVVITGDHGTLFRGQILRGAATWSADDIAERARTFLATKLPASCSRNSSASGSLEAMMDSSDCLLGTHLDRTATETLWLLGSGGVPRCIKQPSEDLAIVDVPC